MRKYKQNDASEGMTLRDYFAAKAMTAWMAGLSNQTYVKALQEQAKACGKSECQHIAQLAFEQADAMIEERDKANR